LREREKRSATKTARRKEKKRKEADEKIIAKINPGFYLLKLI